MKEWTSYSLWFTWICSSYTRVRFNFLLNFEPFREESSSSWNYYSAPTIFNLMFFCKKILKLQFYWNWYLLWLSLGAFNLFLPSICCYKLLLTHLWFGLGIKLWILHFLSETITTEAFPSSAGKDNPESTTESITGNQASTTKSTTGKTDPCVINE